MKLTRTKRGLILRESTSARDDPEVLFQIAADLAKLSKETSI